MEIHATMAGLTARWSLTAWVLRVCLVRWVEWESKEKLERGIHFRVVVVVKSLVFLS